MRRKHQPASRAKYPNRLWRYRRRLGLSQQDVADLIGYLTPSDISKFEHGERLPSLVMALKLEIVYRVPVAFLFPDLYVRLRELIRVKEEARGCKQEMSTARP
jgi:transcriptional regulator with XRE-family HTH domain